MLRMCEGERRFTISASPREPRCYRSQCDDDGSNYINSLSCDDPVNSNPLLTIPPCLGNIFWRTTSVLRSISKSQSDQIIKAQSHDTKGRRSTLGALSEMRLTILRVTERLDGAGASGFLHRQPQLL